MAVINNAAPAPSNEGSGMGFLLGVILLIAFFFLVINYGLPLLQGTGSAAPQINVPGQIDVNVNQK